jgi:hypothetical protein
MKRIAFLFVAMFFLALSLTSCMKTRICECRSALHPDLNENITVGPGSKSKAVAECENAQFNYQSQYPEYTCTLQ